MSFELRKFDHLIEDPKRALLFVMAVSLAVKLPLIAMTEIINPDAVRYINSAHELFQGNISEAFNQVAREEERHARRALAEVSELPRGRA